MGVVGILHQTDEQLELYALGRLAEPQVAEVEEHLLVCAACQERLDDLESYALAMRQAISTEPARSAPWLIWFERFRLQRSWFQPSRLNTSVLTWAGGFAAIVLAVSLFLHFGPHAPVPLASLQLSAMRGAMPTIVAARETDITLTDVPAGLSFRANVVNATGGTVWSGALQPDNPKIELTRQLDPGNYFVRLYVDNGKADNGKAVNGKLLHEYGFQVRP